MADTIIAASLQVDATQAGQQVDGVNKKLTQTSDTVQSFRQQMKIANDELAVTIQKYGQFSTEAQAAAQKLGELQNTARDAQATAAKFAVDGSTSLAAFGGAIRGVTAGFTAVTGAMALFGSQSEDVQKTLLKVQGALALTEGLNSLADTKKAFQDVAAAIKSTSVVQGVYNWVMTGTTVATEAETVATVEATTAAIAFRTALLFLTGAGIVAAIIAITVVLTSQSQAAKDAARYQQNYNDTLKDAAGGFKEAYTQVAELKQQFAEAGTNVNRQKEALDHFNSTVGDSTKQMNNFNEAQAWIANDANTDAYIKAMLARATATAAIGKAAQANFEIQQNTQGIAEQQALIKQGTTYQQLANDAIEYYNKTGDIAGAQVELNKAENEAIKQRDTNSQTAIAAIRVNFLDNLKDLKKQTDDFLKISQNQTDEYNKWQEANGYHKGTKADIEAQGKSLDDGLKKQMDALQVQQDAATEEANRQQLSQSTLTNIQILGQEQRISYLKNYVKSAAGLGADFYKTALDQEKKAENDLTALKDKFHTQELAEGQAKAEADIKREADFVNNLKLVWTTGDLAGTSIPQAGGIITTKASDISGTIQGGIKGQNDVDAAVKEAQKQAQGSISGLGGDLQNYKAQLDALKDFYDQKRVLAQGSADAIAAIDQAEADAKLNLALDTGKQILNNAADAIGKQTVIGKAAAIAATTIDTYQSAQAAYKAMVGIPIVGPTLANIAAGLAIVSGLANIRRIVAVQTPGGTSAGSVPSISASTSAPVLPSVNPQATNTQLNSDQLNQIGNAASRTYVLDSDIQNNRDRDARLNRAARLGGG